MSGGGSWARGRIARLRNAGRHSCRRGSLLTVRSSSAHNLMSVNNTCLLSGVSLGVGVTRLAMPVSLDMGMPLETDESLGREVLLEGDGLLGTGASR